MSTIASPVGPRTRRGVGTAQPRTAARGPLARPATPVAPGRSRVVVACSGVAPVAAVRRDFITGVKVSLIAVVALVGAVASVVEFASWGEPDPTVEYVAGDPAWAHVTGQ